MRQHSDDVWVEEQFGTYEQPLIVPALVYADMGWPVHPLYGITADGQCACRKPDCKSVGKHPRLQDWPNKATCDKDAIIKWFIDWPESNLGIVTGAISRIVVLDVDGQDGEDSIKSLNLPCTVQVKTRRGRHLYFIHPGGTVKNFVGRRPGLDLRGDGGYVVAPPSKHAEGEYEWVL